MLKVGDIVKIKGKFKHLNWVYKPEVLMIVDIHELGDNWIVANLNGVYTDSEGLVSSDFLLSNLEIDIEETRNQIIEDILTN